MGFFLRHSLLAVAVLACCVVASKSKCSDPFIRREWYVPCLLALGLVLRLGRRSKAGKITYSLRANAKHMASQADSKHR